MNEPGTPHGYDTQFTDPQAWRSFAAAFAPDVKETARAHQAAVERENDRVGH